MPRVLLSSSNIEAIENGEEFDLDAETPKKLVRVLRLTPGEVFIGFDGRGREWECALVSVEGEGRKPHARGAAIGECETQNISRLQLSIAQAIPKGDKMEWVLQKGTELGVAEFWPFEASRSVARVLFDEDESERATARAERWRRIVEAAASQCGRADVPVVHAIADFSTVVGFGASTLSSGGRCFLLDESREAESLKTALTRDPLGLEDDAPLQVMLLIGPEGGWTSEERESAERYGVEAISLGSRILRTETAALVAAAILQWETGGMS